MNAHEFYLEVNGKGFDYDHAYGFQCWDLFAYFCHKYCNKVFNCNSTGYVKDLWDNRKTSGILNYFDEVTSINDLKDGDWVILNGVDYPYSHVAMFRLFNSDHTKWTLLGQNQKANDMKACQIWSNVSGFMGAFRLKENNKASFKSSGKATVIVDKLNVRSNHNLNASIEAVYSKGEYFYYDKIIEDSGYIWGHYVSYSGKDRWVALKEINGSNYVSV